MIGHKTQVVWLLEMVASWRGRRTNKDLIFFGSTVTLIIERFSFTLRVRKMRQENALGCLSQYAHFAHGALTYIQLITFESKINAVIEISFSW